MSQIMIKWSVGAGYQSIPDWANVALMEFYLKEHSNSSASYRNIYKIYRKLAISVLMLVSGFIYHIASIRESECLIY